MLPATRGFRSGLPRAPPWGLIAIPRPKLRHTLIQQDLPVLLDAMAEPGSFLSTSVTFRPLPEYELWVADVAYLSAERFRATDPDDYIRGAPELVAEVLSSDTLSDLYDREQMCLENGSLEFWVIDPHSRQIQVTTPDGHGFTYRADAELPVPFRDRAKLKVADILRYETR